MTTVACVLFVKNECTDIAGWIAWHLALGVDRLFIYEDHSTDGTWEVLEAAARVAPITLLRTDPATQPDFYWRQRDAFMDAARRARGVYDWLGFLDGDEYVYPRHFDRIGDFLAQFPDAWAVALNWRIHGNSGRVVRPREMAVETFLSHGTESLGDNVLVKSFVRPEHLGPNYTDPHRYDIPEERYVDARGARVQWTGATKAIDWRDAFVLHFVCRSMEQYIQRIRRRLNADLGDSTAYWDHFNRNDVEDREPLRLMPAVYPVLGRIYTAMLDAASIRLHAVARVMRDDPLLAAALLDRPDLRTPSIDGRSQTSVRTVVLRTHHDTLLCLGGNRIVRDATLDGLAGVVPVLGAIHASTPDLITVFAADRGPLHLPGDSRHLDEPLLRIVPASQPGRFFLRSTHAGRYLAATPGSNDSGVACDRGRADLWEEFRLEPIQSTVTLGLSAIPAPVNAQGATLLDLCAWAQTLQTPPRRGDFLRALANLSPIERERLDHLIPGLLLPFL
ncbi:glycosyltransferase family 2 protein [Tanticharoenia sakaeratensis]|uniref:Glycosyltransferase n=1 Tax=Tanticharoenia sakaeratensis NBRC 103193 TaxID=1231623 RepID=A0A0D6MGC4_9PROT|nr:glycosyltransferase family 2 protein [Tanticharoenia sakaeratensis]GAN52694.1 hypothetical protein Tasa_001_009 [Tanticharoenia sakaeratensis NBRC 103193]GBQ24372.1 hypothetical protein AA103193_2731 [Tanticharoenia sakaeratensis NBRC 103193]